MERERSWPWQSHRRSKTASPFEGLPQVQKPRVDCRLSADPCSYINGSIRDDVPVEIGQSSFGRATVKLLENLLAERTLKETKSPKRPSISSIARLLRREGLPSLWNAHKQKKKLFDSNRQKNTLISIESNRQHDDQSTRRSPKKQQEFEDVYPDLEASLLTKFDMALIQKNLNAKRLTYDETTSEKFYVSEELDDTLEMLDSRLKLMQFGRNQNFSANIVHDQRGTYSSSLGRRTPLLNLQSSAKYGNSDSTVNCNFTYHPDRDNGLLLDPHLPYRAHIAHNLSGIQLEEKNMRNILPTPIVVLNPNVRDRNNEHGSSPYHSQGYIPDSRRMKEYLCVGSVKEWSLRKTKSYDDAEFMKPVSEDSRKLANKVTRRLRDAYEASEDGMYSGLEGYLVYESLHDARENDLDCELEMLWSSRSSLDDNKMSRDPSFRSVPKEAKKRLAEGCNITQRHQNLEIVCKVSTLGEMLFIPGGENRSNKTTHGCIDRSSTQVGIDNGRSIWHDLSDTISGGDLRNKTESTSRSRSVLPIGGRIYGKGTFHDMLASERHMLHTEPTSHGTSKVTLPNPSHKDHSSVDDESSSSTVYDRKDFCHQELQQGVSEEGDSSLKYFGAEPAPSESSKDADYASPVSVLEVPSTEDASSSSGSVERVSAELNELRMQLQLLKMECDAYDDKSSHFAIGKDSVHSFLRAKGWEVSYALDVLIHASLQDFGFDLLRKMWHTPCPLDSRLFYNLEEKYCNGITGSRPERRLLFDRINSVLSEIFLKHVDVRPWVMPKLAGSFHVAWLKERAKDTVEKLLGQEANGLQVSETMLDRNMQWTDSTEEIVLTGNEIEELLIDDMINEFLLDLYW